MVGLADTVAELVARARAATGADVDGELPWVANFGPNPGQLRMRLRLPKDLDGRAPLVVVLHGCAQTATGYASGAGWVELADRYGFALLCPEQVRANNANLCFDWFQPGDASRGHGEAASIAQMVRFTLGEHDLDPARVFITGLSAGGAMTATMLATYPELFMAGAVVAGLPFGAASDVQQALAVMRHMPDLSPRAWGDKVRAESPSPSRWPRISIWHGEADTTVTIGASEALARQWCDVHGLTRSLHEPTEARRHAHESWRRPDGEVAVELHRLAGLAHGTPISADGGDGCGKAAPWILEAGVSSSLEIARFWRIAGTPSSRRGQSRPAASKRPEAARAGPPAVVDVGETIARALRSAGLMR